MITLEDFLDSSNRKLRSVDRVDSWNGSEKRELVCRGNLTRIGEDIYFASIRQTPDKELVSEFLKYNPETNSGEQVLTDSIRIPSQVPRIYEEIFREFGSFRYVLPLEGDYIATLEKTLKKELLNGTQTSLGGCTTRMHDAQNSRVFLSLYNLKNKKNRKLDLTAFLRETMPNRRDIAVTSLPELLDYDRNKREFSLLFQDSGCFHSTKYMVKIPIEGRPKAYSDNTTSDDEKAIMNNHNDYLWGLKLRQDFAKNLGEGVFYTSVGDSLDGLSVSLEKLDDTRNYKTFFDLDLSRDSERRKIRIAENANPDGLRNSRDPLKFQVLGAEVEYKPPYISPIADSIRILPGGQSALIGVMNDVYRVVL